MNRLVSVVAVALAMNVGACGGSEFESGDPVPSTGSGGSSGASTGGTAGASGGPTCETTCLPLPPPAWRGPVKAVLAPGDVPPDCPHPHYVDRVESGHASIHVALTACSCKCSSDYSSVVLDSFSGTSCNVPCDSTTINAGSCSPPPENCTAASTKMQVGPMPDACTGASTAEVPPVQLDTVSLCASPEPPPLEGCEPGSFCSVDAGGEICVWRSGDFDCPTGFGTRRVLHKSFVDTRGCSECDCSTTGSIGMLTVHHEASCSTFSSSFAVPSACVNFPSIVGFGLSYAVDAEAYMTCEATNPAEAIGEVTGVEPVTACCI